MMNYRDTPISNQWISSLCSGVNIEILMSLDDDKVHTFLSTLKRGEQSVNSEFLLKKYTLLFSPFDPDMLLACL